LVQAELQALRLVLRPLTQIGAILPILDLAAVVDQRVPLDRSQQVVAEVAAVMVELMVHKVVLVVEVQVVEVVVQ
jgi:hypothetical protein